MRNEFPGSCSVRFRGSREPSLGLLATASLLILFCAWTFHAQSGRRAPKQLPTPSATPEPTPDKPKTETEKPSLNLVLGIDEQGSFLNIPLNFYDAVLASCADRLRDAGSIKLDVVGRDLNRSEAIKRAKAEKEAFVVLLELRTDDASGRYLRDYEEIFIQYSVFAPETAKIVGHGRTYQRAYQTGGVVVGPRTSGRNNSIYTERLLKLAARDAAERILKAVR